MNLWTNLLGLPKEDLLSLTDVSRLAGSDGESLVVTAKQKWFPLPGCDNGCELCSIPCRIKGCSVPCTRVMIMQNLSQNKKIHLKFQACASNCGPLPPPNGHKNWFPVIEDVVAKPDQAKTQPDPQAAAAAYISHCRPVIHRAVMCHVAAMT